MTKDEPKNTAKITYNERGVFVESGDDYENAMYVDFQTIFELILKLFKWIIENNRR